MVPVPGRVRVGGPGPRRGARTPNGTAGQAAVELASVLVLLAMLVLLLVQVALVVRDQLLVVHAARDAARLASTGAENGEVESRVDRALPGADVAIERGEDVGDPVRVEVTYRSYTDVPLIGSFIPDLDLHQAATMRAEQ